VNSIYKIASARPQDLSALPNIELAAAVLLAGHAPDSVLNEVTSEQAFKEAQSEGRLWVALADDQPVGFVHVELLAHDEAHLKEIDVHPDHGRRGLGTRLVATACEWAADGGFADITLTTFRDVPWNMPFYARMGFEVVPTGKLSPALLLIVADETRRGLDPARRVVMRRSLREHTNARITQTSKQDLPRLFEVWESSVRATHSFLSETDIRSLVPLARAEIATFSPIYCVRDNTGQPFAMLAVEGAKIEMLFVHPDYRGMGAGRRLIEFAVRELHADSVDVNEQNDAAVQFYRHMGFCQVGRSAQDASGNPWPLLHLALQSNSVPS